MNADEWTRLFERAAAGDGEDDERIDDADVREALSTCRDER